MSVKIINSSSSAATATIKAKYYSTSSPSITTTPAAIKFTTQDFDSNSAYDTSTGLFTAPRTATYFVSFSMFINSSFASGNAWVGEILKNGSVIQGGVVTTGGSSNTQHSLTLSCLVNCTAGDTIQVYSFVDSGGSLTLLATNDNQVSIFSLP